MKKQIKVRMAIIKTIAGRGLKSSLTGYGWYILVLLNSVIAALLIRNYVTAVEEQGILVLSSPLGFPFSIVITVSAFYLAVTASIAVSREKDNGTLEVLFYGPVEAETYVLAKYFEQLCKYLLMLVFYGVLFTVFGFLTNFNTPSELGPYILASVGLGSNIIAGGLLISTLTNKIRNSILLLIALMSGFLGFHFLEIAINNLNLSMVSPAFNSSLTIINFIARVVKMFSPFETYSGGIKALALRDFWSALNNILIVPGIYFLVFTSITIYVFKKKGIKSR